MKKKTNHKKVDLVVGIPSYNEADSISEVIKQVDVGLQKYFKDKKSVIINVDNDSQDNTKEVFLNVKTKTPKMYISTPPNVKGKGNNLKNLFEKIIELEAEAGMTIDADIKSISPDWIKKLFLPILSDNCDLITPVYFREKTDGTITNHICYPLLLGILGISIRQPIGGDMAFSKKLIRHWLKLKWTEAVTQYGVDIFMTTEAIKNKFKICEVSLGKKIHKPSNPKLGPMFIQVVETLFEQLASLKDLSYLGDPVRSHGRLGRPASSGASWARILYDTFYAYDTASTPEQKQKIIKDLYPAFSSHKAKLLDEKEVIKQAEDFFQNRNYLFKKYY